MTATFRLATFLAWLLFAAGAFAQTGGAQPSPPAPETQPAEPPAPASPAEPVPPVAEEAPAAEEGAPVTEGHAVVPGDAYDAPEIFTDLAQLPFPARRMHELLIEAARSGDIEKLRPYVGKDDDQTLLSFGGLEEDPIEFLKSISGDGEGHEILAILQEVLEAGFVRLEGGTENEIYVWPYFHAMQLDKLTPQQRVELFRLVTFGDYEEMQSFGAYNFYRAGITPEGRWRFFVAGD